MEDWKTHHRASYLQHIISGEAYPEASLCTQCGKSDGLYRCGHCTGRALWCEACCLKVHQTSPFHRPRKWNGRYFKKIDLDHIGFTIFLGHGRRPCPNLPRRANYTAAPHSVDEDGDVLMDADGEEGWEDEVQTGFIGDRLRIADTTGIFERRVRWCCCVAEAGAVIAHDIQLLDAHLYPATSGRPSTAFTFNVLDEFVIDALECKTSAMSFLSKLRRLTDRVSPLSTAVRESI